MTSGGHTKRQSIEYPMNHFGDLRFSDRSPPVPLTVLDGNHASVDRATNYRALIVEDEILVAWHLESLLQDMKIDVCGIVSNGPDALDSVLSNDIELVFMDVNLHGELDGVEIAQQILERRQVPIVFVTAYADEPSLTRIKSLVPGAPIISKPATASAINVAIQKLSSI